MGFSRCTSTRTSPHNAASLWLAWAVLAPTPVRLHFLPVMEWVSAIVDGRLLEYRIYIRLARCCSLFAFFDTEDEFCLGERS